jgi:hypothetical protein
MKHFICTVLIGGLLPALLGQATAPQKMQGVVVYLRDGGFVPSHVEVPPGKLFLLVVNRSGADQTALGVVREDGVVAVAPVASTSRSQNFQLDLPVGVHTLSDSSHSAWSKLTITIH